ncbi:MAG: hypothetical protein ONA69_03420, partial [candidate division KSB1 bacterium]|nr:hypothetical protein [candidate division KSB1 bacterium]
TTVSPVTQTAEAAVKRASTYRVWPSPEQIGRYKIKEPNKIRVAKLIGSTVSGRNSFIDPVFLPDEIAFSFSWTNLLFLKNVATNFAKCKIFAGGAHDLKA